MKEFRRKEEKGREMKGNWGEHQNPGGTVNWVVRGWDQRRGGRLVPPQQGEQNFIGGKKEAHTEGLVQDIPG